LPNSHGSKRTAWHLPLGRVAYGEALGVQEGVHQLRVAGRIPDTVITVEHDPVITIGRRGSSDNVLAPSEVLKREGIHVIHVDRGGDATYHGPGQLVAYPIVDLREYGRDIKAYVERLEHTAIRTLACYKLAAKQRVGFPGIWVGDWKVGSIGIAVRRWVSRHGVALNLAVRSDHFRLINPCGLGVEVTSLADHVEEPPSMDVFVSTFVSNMADVFDWSIERVTLADVRNGRTWNG